MVAADTTILVRLISRDDPSQTTAADAFVEQGVWVSVLALGEAVWVLGSAYKRGRGELVVIIERLLENKMLVQQDTEIVQAALDVFRSRTGVSFSDCLILETARRARHLTVGTFDRTFAKLDDVQKL